MKRALLFALAMFVAAPAQADDPTGTITITIQNHACSNAPSVQTASEHYPNVDCAKGGGVTVASVEITTEDGFRGIAMVADPTGKGVCVTMMAFPAHRFCGPNSDGNKLFEAHLLLEVMTVHLEGTTPGDNLSKELAIYYGHYDPSPRKLPILANVAHFTPPRSLNGTLNRTASQVSLTFDLQWVTGTWME